MPPKASAEAAASHFLLSPDDIQITDTDLANPLGQGSYGIVYKGLHKRISVAVKQLLAPDLAARQLAEFKQEVALMASFHYDYIVRLYGFTEVKPYRIVMEFMAKGSLFQVLHSTEELSWIQRIQWGKEIAMGIDYLHTREPKIIHRDLKSLNILINGQHQAKLTDFGSAIAKLRTITATVTSTSKKEKNETENTNLVGSTRWMAPELFENELDPTYTPATDIFAYAIVLWELSAREIPYSTVTDDTRIERAILKGTRAKIDTAWPDIFQTLLPLCWHQDPNHRPSANEAIESFEKATPSESIDPAVRDAYIDSLIKPIYEDFLKKVASLLAVHHTIFISYAWPKLPEEKELQLFLARLYDDFTQHLQLDVIWDLKSLKPGMDIEDFMCRGVLDSYRVLMIGTPTYAERAADAKTNVHKEITHMARKRGIEKDSIIPLLYCGEWATAFPRGYNQVLAVTMPCNHYLNFYKSLPNILSSLLGLLPEDIAQYNHYTEIFLAELERLIAAVTDEQIRTFNKENFFLQTSTLQQEQQLLTRRCNTLRQDYPTYQIELDLTTLRVDSEPVSTEEHIQTPEENLASLVEPVKSVAPEITSPPDQKKSEFVGLTPEEIESLRKEHETLNQAERSKKSSTSSKPAASTTSATFFPTPPKPVINQADVEKLLLHVAKGEQNEAEAILKIKDNEALLLQKGNVTDYSNRTFKNITAFQYALWALDWHMWKMILKYLAKDEAARQLQDLESYSTEHDQQYDFTPLIQAYQNYTDQFDTLCKKNDFNTLKNLWIKGVGDAQVKVPAHVANEYCYPDRCLDPKTSFTEDTLLRRLKIYKDNKFFPLARYSWGALSSDFAISTDYYLDLCPPLRHPPRSMLTPEQKVAQQDQEAMMHLNKIRIQQYQELKCELAAQLGSRFSPDTFSILLTKFLTHVVRGEQGQAEAMLKIKGNEALLLQKGKVTDYSNRTFKNITAFQYAIWALDWHMWKMILKYLNKDEAARQLQDLEDNSTEHGQHYDFKPLIQAYQAFMDKHKSWNANQCKYHGIKVIGCAQTKVPAHVANEYCRPDQSFDPKPSFIENKLPRTFDLNSNNKFFPLTHYSWGALSSNFAVLKGDCRGAITGVDDWWGVNPVKQDLNAISELRNVRTRQYQELKMHLGLQPAVKPKENCLMM